MLLWIEKEVACKTRVSSLVKCYDFGQGPIGPHRKGRIETPEPVESVADRRERAVGLREAGWSNKQIARQLGVHASTVGRWFSREHPPNSTESETTGDES